MQQPAVVPPRPAPRPVRPAGGWWLDALLLAGFVALTVALARGHLLTLDTEVAAWVRAHQPTVLHWAALILNYLGQGGLLLTPTALVLAVALAARTRSVRPLVVFVAAFVLLYLTVGPLKLWTDRAAPRSTLPDKVELFNALPPGEYGLSYPSGHVANSILWYGVIALLLGALLRRIGRPLAPGVVRLVRAAPPAIVFCTTTYLAYHWITDSVAGLLLGLLLTRLLARVPWDALPLPRLPGGWDRPAGLDT